MTAGSVRSWEAQRGERTFVSQARRRAILAAALDRNQADPAAVALADAIRAGEAVDLAGVHLLGLAPGIDPDRRYRITPDGSVSPLA